MLLARSLLALALVSSNCYFPLAYASNVPPVHSSEKLIDMLKSFKFEDSTGAKMNIDHVVVVTENKPYKEIIEVLISRVEAQVANLESKGGGKAITQNQLERYRVIEHVINVLGLIAPASYYDRVASLAEKTLLIMEADKVTTIDAAAYEKSLAVYLKKLESNKSKVLMSFAGSAAEVAPPPVATADIKTELSEFESLLNAEVKGQPEVVSALLDIRRRDLIYGYRSEPAIIWLMGLPGTGKDTSAMAFVNAYFKSPKAHEKHMFKVTPLINKADTWTFLGSSTGYVGSESFPPLLDFLVKHSGGKYIKVAATKDKDGNATSHKIVLNEEWKEGDVLEGYFPPESAVVYLDEFHAWSKQMKDLFVKKALEPAGGFVVNNPNGGVDRLQVPVTFVIGSNDGIELVAAREKNGQRFGKPLSYDELIERHKNVANNTTAIKNSIMAGNGNINDSSSREDARGTSEELLNRIHTFKVMRPLSPLQLQAIAENKIRAIYNKLAKSRSGYSQVKLTYSKELIEFIQSYQYVAEDNARPLDQKIASLVETPLFDAFTQGHIKPNQTMTIELGLIRNADKTYSLSLVVDGQPLGEALPIKATENEKAKAPISDARLDELDQMEGRLNKRVVGQSKVVGEVSSAVKLSEEGRQGISKPEDATQAARSFMLLGLSSTGKSELGKALGEELFGSRNATVTIQFSKGTTEHELRAKLIGLRDASGNPIPSDFMKHYDRNGGRLVVMLDEVANVEDKNILNILYDLLREPVVTTFSDGIPRVMSNVIFMVTGNAGQELYTALPPNLPEVVRRAALSEIHAKTSGNPNLRREMLSQYFSEALINRVGEGQIFDFAPLSYLAASELVQIKIEGAIKDLKEKEGQRGWNINFRNEKAYRQTVDGIEREGFIAREQGASIDHFVKKKFTDGLRQAFLKHRVQTGSDVILDFIKVEKLDDGDGMDEAADRNVLVIGVETSDGKKFELRLDGKQLMPALPELKQDMIVTAFHEAGHELVRATYLRDFFEPKGIKIIPGVAHIGGKWVHYAGVANSMKRVQTQLTREYLVREIAVLFGGFIAEDLIIKGGYSSHGKQNDIERATHLAELGILQLGLSEVWGVRNADKATLSDADKELLKQETQKLFDEAKILATEAIVANAKTFEALGNELAAKGQLNGADIEAIYKKVGLLVETDSGYDKAAKAGQEKYKQAPAQGRKGLRYEFVSTFNVLEEAKVVDIVAQLEAARSAEIAKLTVSSKIPFKSAFDAQASKASGSKAAAGATCESLLEDPKK